MRQETLTFFIASLFANADSAWATAHPEVTPIRSRLATAVTSISAFQPGDALQLHCPLAQQNVYVRLSEARAAARLPARPPFYGIQIQTFGPGIQLIA
jgi:hypothetical protein